MNKKRNRKTDKLRPSVDVRNQSSHHSSSTSPKMAAFIKLKIPSEEAPSFSSIDFLFVFTFLICRQKRERNASC
ncbi:hypothetical protein OUZ56_013981 [Daphnia magna]|uniref:Uncharacterized protein n=1 Tax=Daphnia magna TaxID=35525 RepID=A0ABQ9Z7I3_9CRUS|nr:hypothetical protein OUZ56_013981 [Daphnia magna]